MKKKETLEEKAYRLWKTASLPDFFNKKGPKKTPAWKIYLAHLAYTDHAPAWRRARDFMEEYYELPRHWTMWQKAIAKWPQEVWDALQNASAGDEECGIAAIDGTTLSRSNPSKHYLRRIGSEDTVNRPVQEVLMIDVKRRMFLAWRFRSSPRGEKCDIPYLIEHSPTLPELVLMDKGFDSNPLHRWLRERGIWSVAPVRKGCKRGQYRREMRNHFDWCLYWQRNIVESMISAVKRLYGVHVRARTWRTQRAEIYSRLISYNLRRFWKCYFLLSLLRSNY
jgi:hypothetical protein